jgi:hypothetical protein
MKGIVIVGLLAMGVGVSVEGGDWRVEVVDGLVQGCSVDVTPNGTAHLAWIPQFSRSVLYAHREAGQWIHGTFESHEVGPEVDLHLGPDGRPRVAFTQHDLNADQWHVVLTSLGDGGWTNEDAAGAGARPSLAVDRLGSPSIAYLAGTDGQVFLAHPRAGVWMNRQLTNNAATGVSLALDGDRHPHFAYIDRNEGALKYARFDGTAWTFERVAALGPITPIDRPSLALTSDARPFIAYGKGSTMNVATKAIDGSWRIAVVESVEGGGVASLPALRIDIHGDLHLGYAALEPDHSYTLRYAHRRPLAQMWTIQVVDHVPVLWELSLAVDSAPHVYFAYVAIDPLRELRYATNSPVDVQ